MSSNNNGRTRYEIIFEYGNLQQYTADEHTSKVLAIAEHNNRDEREEARFRKALVAGLRGHDSIGTLAEICCISESTFKRRFRARYSASPHHWFLHHRLCIARHLAETTGLTISELARLCGFRNVSHFISLFRSHFNTTPLRLRHSHERRRLAVEGKDMIITNVEFAQSCRPNSNTLSEGAEDDTLIITISIVVG